MKFILLVMLMLLCAPVIAFEKSYNVSGVIENGGAVEGSARSNPADRDVYGELTDQDGNSHSYEGDWIGRGQISGETDEGEAVDLYVK